MFERVLNTPLHHLKTQTISEKERSPHKNYYKNVCDEGRLFLVKVLTGFENSKNHLNIKSVIFNIGQTFFQKNACGQFALILGIVQSEKPDLNVSVRDKPKSWGKIHF